MTHDLKKTRSKYFTLRFWMFQLHLWLGLLVGISFTLVGFSGSMMIACEWLDSWNNADVVYVTPNAAPKPFSQVLAAFKKEYPNASITSVAPPKADNRSWVFVIPVAASKAAPPPSAPPTTKPADDLSEERRAQLLKDMRQRRERDLAAASQPAASQPATRPAAASRAQAAQQEAPPAQTIAQWKARRQQRALAVRRVFVDPYSLQVLGERHSGIRTDTYVFWEHMHYFLLLDQKNGYPINGWLGVATLVVLATGLVLWWPNTLKLLITRLWVKWKAPWARVNWDLHAALGFWTLPLLFIVMLTGIFYPFNAPWRSAINQATGTPENPPTPLTLKPIASSGASATLEEMLTNLAVALPSAQVLTIANVDSPNTDLRVSVNEPSYGILYRNTVVIDRASGQVVSIDRPVTANAYILRGIFPVHAGYIFGNWMRVVFFILGIAPLILFLTGTWIWLSRQIKKFKARRSQPRTSANHIKPQPHQSM